MQNNQQNQETQFYQELSGQALGPLINSEQEYQPQSDGPKDLLQEYPKPSDIQSNTPQNLNCPPNQQLLEKNEEVFEIQNTVSNQNQKSIKNYVLPPVIQPSGDKLIIPFTKCVNIAVEILMILSSGTVIGVTAPIAKIYTAIIFVIEQILALYFANKRLELIKDIPNKKLKVHIINYLCCARKKENLPFRVYL